MLEWFDLYKSKFKINFIKEIKGNFLIFKKFMKYFILASRIVVILAIQISFVVGVIEEP